ncbi:hypothetical protein OSB04_001590 [Centaurea solstitialis]|uniref:Uncharacterized protein n=1 Tax=Centaurea solstitialis TaxID=347529 RepID=A0AA38WUI7_9ASTR|nr:hypothetical protein OSB04_001590 [Centaurea solstitialis]
MVMMMGRGLVANDGPFTAGWAASIHAWAVDLSAHRQFLPLDPDIDKTVKQRRKKQKVEKASSFSAMADENPFHEVDGPPPLIFPNQEVSHGGGGNNNNNNSPSVIPPVFQPVIPLVNPPPVNHQIPLAGDPRLQNSQENPANGILQPPPVINQQIEDEEQNIFRLANSKDGSMMDYAVPILNQLHSGIRARQMLDATARGAFTTRSYNEGYLILERISNNNGHWVNPRSISHINFGLRDADTQTTLVSQLSDIMATALKKLTTDKQLMSVYFLNILIYPSKFSMYIFLYLKKIRASKTFKLSCDIQTLDLILRGWVIQEKFTEELKAATEPKEGVYNYKLADKMLDFVRANQIVARETSSSLANKDIKKYLIQIFIFLKWGKGVCGCHVPKLRYNIHQNYVVLIKI